MWANGKFSLDVFMMSIDHPCSSYVIMGKSEMSISLPFPVLFHNTHYTIIDKPAGLPVYKKSTNAPSVEQHILSLAHKGKGPWLVHRLDQDTSGCLLIATRKQALIEAQKYFADHTVQKTYWAILHGAPPSPEGIIDVPLYKNNSLKGWHIEVDFKKGQPAQTLWKILGQAHLHNQTYTWVALTPLTGRTHQLRVHCASQGFPIVGDQWYGLKEERHTMLHLHNYRLILPCDPRIDTIAPPSHHMHTLLKACGCGIGSLYPNKNQI